MRELSAEERQFKVLVEDRHVPELLWFRDADPPPPAAKLTPRETACLQCLADGEKPSEALFLSYHTVKYTLARTYRKLGVTDQASAVYAALRAGYIS